MNTHKWCIVGKSQYGKPRVQAMFATESEARKALQGWRMSGLANRTFHVTAPTAGMSVIL